MRNTQAMTSADPELTTLKYLLLAAERTPGMRAHHQRHRGLRDLCELWSRACTCDWPTRKSHANFFSSSHAQRWTTSFRVCIHVCTVLYIHASCRPSVRGLPLSWIFFFFFVFVLCFVRPADESHLKRRTTGMLFQPLIAFSKECSRGTKNAPRGSQRAKRSER